MIQFAECRLRRIGEGDLAQVLEWRNSERVRAHMYTDHLISVEEHRAWFERQSANPATSVWIFDYLTRPAGLVNFTEIERETCTWGFYIGREDLPKGSGLAMGYLALDYAFGELKLSSTHGEALEPNAASIHYHRTLGFAAIPPRRGPVTKGGNAVPVVSFRLTREAWVEQRKALAQRVFGGSV